MILQSARDVQKTSPLRMIEPFEIIGRQSWNRIEKEAAKRSLKQQKQKKEEKRSGAATRAAPHKQIQGRKGTVLCPRSSSFCWFFHSTSIMAHESHRSEKITRSPTSNPRRPTVIWFLSLHLRRSCILKPHQELGKVFVVDETRIGRNQDRHIQPHLRAPGCPYY